MMKLRKVLCVTITIAAILFLPEQSKAQNLEVEGQAKIAVMHTDKTYDDVVERQADGALAVRYAATLTQASTFCPAISWL